MEGRGSVLVSSSPSSVPIRCQLLDNQKYFLTDRSNYFYYSIQFGRYGISYELGGGH